MVRFAERRSEKYVPGLPGMETKQWRRNRLWLGVFLEVARAGPRMRSIFEGLAAEPREKVVGRGRRRSLGERGRVE